MAGLVGYLKRTRSALWGERPRHEEGAAIGGDSGVLLLLQKGTVASISFTPSVQAMTEGSTDPEIKGMLAIPITRLCDQGDFRRRTFLLGNDFRC